MSDVSFATHARAVLDALTAAGQAATPQWLVGDAVVPDGAGWQGTPGQSNYVGYALLSDISGGTWEGSMATAQDDPTEVFQFTCVGATPGQARSIADAGRSAARGMRNTVTGGYIVDAVRFDFGSENMLRDDDVKPAVFFSPLRVRFVMRRMAAT